MSAGLPGLGLGGLFFVICALLAPFVELARTLRGRSSAAAWAQTMRQFSLALAMVVAFELVRRAIAVVTAGAGAFDVRTIGVTVGVLAAVLLLAKVAELVAVSRRRRTARAASRRARALGRYSPAAPRLAPDSEG
jgi:hypothetical protein